MNNLSPLQLGTDLEMIHGLTACPVKTADNKRLRQARISEVERHIENLRRFALLKPGKIQRIILDQVKAVETLLALACRGNR